MRVIIIFLFLVFDVIGARLYCLFMPYPIQEVLPPFFFFLVFDIIGAGLYCMFMPYPFQEVLQSGNVRGLFIGGCLFIREEFTVRECQDFWLPLKSAFSWKDQLHESGRLFIFDLERKIKMLSQACTSSLSIQIYAYIDCVGLFCDLAS